VVSALGYLGFGLNTTVVLNYGRNWKKKRNMLNNKYSLKEIELLDALDIHPVIRQGISPLRVYETAALKVFRENRQGPAVDSLRRCLNYLEYAGNFRCNDAFDSLIRL
jgi:hypothetical protein